MKFINKNETENERHILFLYITANNKWEVLQEGLFSRNTNLLMNEGIIITCSRAHDEIIIYAKNDRYKYVEVQRRKFTGFIIILIFKF